MTGRKGGEYNVSSALQRVLDNIDANFKKRIDFVNNMSASLKRSNPPQRDVARDQKTHEVQTIATSSPSTSNYILSSRPLYNGLHSIKYFA